MKAKNIALILAVGLFWASPAPRADSAPADAHAHIGVLLDTAPLPDLLTKHLGLSPGQGVRIRNVQRGSPGDRAGLERDDIIVGFEGEDVNGYECEKFVDAVRKAGVGTEVSLEIVHLGERKTLKFKLEPFKAGFELKYPAEPELVQSWLPGKIFRLKPGDERWTEILRDDMPPEFRVNLNRFFKELYTFQHSVDGEDCTIIIEGNPDDEDTVITVRMGDTEYKTTLREMDKLPEKHRKAAEQALKDARKSSKTRGPGPRVAVPFRQTPQDWKSYFDRLYPRVYPPAPPFGPGNEMFDKIQKQMRDLQQRMEQLEKRQRQAPKPFLDEPDKNESQGQEKSLQPEEEDEQEV